MKKDYSEYRPSDYEKYCRIRSDRKGFNLHTFYNRVHFYPEDRSFHILVDDRMEYHTMQDLIDEDQAAEDAERGHTAAEIPEEDAREFAQNRADDERHNSEIIQKMQMRYRMDRERAEHNRDLSCQEEGWTKEPFINVFSGSFIALNYGEGLLDFIYADFVTPLNKVYRRAYLWEEMLRITREKKGIEKHQETAEKVLNSTQTQVMDFFNYVQTFRTVQDIAYASLYSAICPPCFDEGTSATAAIRCYGDYLVALQKEYLELIEFCYDEDLYPDALGKLYPSERYAILRNYQDIPSVSTRKETVSFSAIRGSGDTMPYGLPGSELIGILRSKPEKTADHIALAEKLGVSADELALRIHLRSFMTVEYHFRSVQEILELEFTKMLEQKIRFRKCRRCGKYFIMKGNYDTHYCDRIAEGETRNCQELAAAEKYRAKIADNKAIPVYNKYYKRYAARVKARQIKENDFKKWRYRAISLRNDCADGIISLEEYIQWMEDSFPNRKSKTDG